MANSNLAEGHLNSPASYQNDGLRDSDVLSSPTLSNFLERGMLNGVVPVTMNAYNSTTRNDTLTGNCTVRLSGSLGSTSSVIVDAGTVCLDGMFFSLSQTTYNLGTNTANLHNTHSSTAITNPAGANDEAIMLIYVDPRLPNNVGIVFGSFVDTSSGLYPSSPSAHLDRQSVVLASVRVGKGASTPVVLAIEDKRSFFRAGPLPLAKTIHSDGSASNLRNDFVAGFNAADFPISNMGVLFARDPAGFHTGGTQGDGQVHLFFNSDQGDSPIPGGGGTYQITPVHRTSMKTGTYASIPGGVLTYGAGGPTALTFAPLTSEDDAAVFLVDIYLHDNAVGGSRKRLVQGVDYTITPTQITITDPGTYPSPAASLTHYVITYTHACHG